MKAKYFFNYPGGEKKMEGNEQSISNTWTNIKQSDVHWSHPRKRKKAEKYLKKY